MSPKMMEAVKRCNDAVQAEGRVRIEHDAVLKEWNEKGELLRELSEKLDDSVKVVREAEASMKTLMLQQGGLDEYRGRSS